MSEPALVEFGKVDRRGWPSGLWDEEPDIVRYIDPASERPCQIRRGASGHLCGYIGVGPQHPWYKAEYEHIAAEAHGGLTFAGWWDDDHSLWWVGFDCAHLGDLVPAIRKIGDETYKDVHFVKGECARLAVQAKEAIA